MSEFCDYAHAEFCAELAVVHRINKVHRNCKILQILFSNIALSSALMASTASAKHVDVKVIKYFIVLLHVWSICWIQTSPNSTAYKRLKTLFVSCHGISPPGTGSICRLAEYYQLYVIYWQVTRKDNVY